jgi:hypothetical protein
MSGHGADSFSDQRTDRSAANFHPYFSGKEYNKLVSSMQALRNLIEKTEMTQRDMGEQEKFDADFVFWDPRIEEDLAAIRVKLDQHLRQLPRRVRWTSYTHVDNQEPLERGKNGHVIHDLGLIKRSRMEKIGRSPEAQYALHTGHRDGILQACTLWVVARLVGSYFGVWASYAKWMVIVLGLTYMLRPKYIDSYPSMNASREIKMDDILCVMNEKRREDCSLTRDTETVLCAQLDGPARLRTKNFNNCVDTRFGNGLRISRHWEALGVIAASL